MDVVEHISGLIQSMDQYPHRVVSPGLRAHLSTVPGSGVGKPPSPLGLPAEDIGMIARMKS